MADLCDDDDDDGVGYRKPPKHTRFRPGKSGNPKGRPKKSRNFKTDLEEELFERVLIKEGGKPKRVSKQRAMLKSVSAKAMGGSISAFIAMANLIYRYLHIADAAEEEVKDLSESDQEILEAFRKRTADQIRRGGKPERTCKVKPMAQREPNDE